MIVREGNLVVTMEQDYTTESGNVGERTFQAGCDYIVDPHLLKEVQGARVCRLLTDSEMWRSRPVAPIRPDVEIVPAVTRWISANGLDTHHLVAGVPIKVPANLAAWLQTFGYATKAAA